MKSYPILLSILLSCCVGCSLYLELEPVSGGDSDIPDLGVSDLQEEDMDQSWSDFAEADLPETDFDFDFDSDLKEDMSDAIGWDKVVAGRNHTCALNFDGEAWCWGSGLFGQLGSGNEDSVAPLKVPLDDPLVDLALGADFSCGVSATSRLYCWGTLPGGETNRAPFLFDDASWENLKANSFHACGLRNGVLHCFGSDSHGQLGLGTPGPSSLVAQPAPMLGTLVDFAVSEFQSCALIDAPARQLWCVGARLDSIGPSTAGRREIPITEAYAAIAGGQDHFCALTEQGEPHCFGRADYLPILRASGSLMEPGPFTQGQEFDSISLGKSTGCGFSKAGAVLCWGGNRRGKLGRGTEQTSDSMALGYGVLNYAGGFRSIAVGVQHACGVTDTDPEILCWGEHFPSATGLDPGYSHIPQKVISEEVFEELAVGAFTTCGTGGGRVSCWGRNYPSLGLNATIHIENPTVLEGLTATSVVGGGDFYCANSPENLKCWGANTYGKLGNNSSSTSSSIPVNFFLSGSFEHIALGNGGGCGIQTVSGVSLQYCWGRRQLLGRVATMDSRIPILLDDPHKPYVQMAVGVAHACGLDQNGQTYCWGENEHRQLGNNSSSFSSGPVLVSGGLLFSEISVGDDITCGLADQSVYCWGVGQATGGTSMADLGVPTRIAHMGALYGIHGNKRTLCGVDENGAVYCWGSNERGQAGAPRSERIGPPQKVALPGKTKMVRSGETHSCALLETGEIYCWGDASFYALGDGRFGMSLSPTPINR